MPSMLQVVRTGTVTIPGTRGSATRRIGHGLDVLSPRRTSLYSYLYAQLQYQTAQTMAFEASPALFWSVAMFVFSFVLEQPTSASHLNKPGSTHWSSTNLASRSEVSSPAAFALAI